MRPRLGDRGVCSLAECTIRFRLGVFDFSFEEDERPEAFPPYFDSIKFRRGGETSSGSLVAFLSTLLETGLALFCEVLKPRCNCEGWPVIEAYIESGRRPVARFLGGRGDRVCWLGSLRREPIVGEVTRVLGTLVFVPVFKFLALLGRLRVLLFAVDGG